MMSPRERVMAVLNGEEPDRCPVDYWATGEVTKSLYEHTGAADELDLYRRLAVDKLVIVNVNYPKVEPGPEDEPRNMWGVPLKGIQAGDAYYSEFAHAPMQDFEEISELEDYPYWPDPNNYLYDEAVQKARVTHEDFAVLGPWVSFFEIYCQLRGLEQGLMDLIEDPDFVEAALDKIESIQTRMMEEYFRRANGAVDLVFVSDDMAGQTSLLMSVEMWRRHLAPRLRRWCEMIHRHGLRVFYHTDGAAGDLIGPLTDCGIDVLNPIQHACPGMDCERLKGEFGDRLIFHGGVDNQQVLPFGSPEDVRKEVRHLKRTLGANRKGFICATCHNAQPGTTVENMLAMIDEAKKPW